MQLTVNGEARELADTATVRDLLLALGMAKAIVAVEVNREVVPRRLHETTRLQAGDVVEVVTLVGGG